MLPTCVCYNMIVQGGHANVISDLVILTLVQGTAMCKYVVCVYAQESGPVSMETGCQRKDGHTSKRGKMASAQRNESSESSNGLCPVLIITQP